MEEKKDIYILGIESSCDDTSAAVLKNGVLLSNVTASQEVHRAYGGVVPELASRAHQQNVVAVVDRHYEGRSFCRSLHPWSGIDGFAPRGCELRQGFRPFAQYSDD